MPEDQAQNVKDGTPRHVFNMVVRDFDRAVGAARFSGLQSFLIQRAREESWVEAAIQERRDAIPFRFDLKELAAFLRCNLSALYDAWHWLLAVGVFRPSGEKFLIQRYFERWIDPGTDTPFLPAHIIKDCLLYRKLRKRQRIREKPNDSFGKNQISVMEKPNGFLGKTEGSSGKTKTSLIADCARVPELDEKKAAAANVLESEDAEPFETIGNPVKLGGPGRDSSEAILAAKWAEHLGPSPDGYSYSKWLLDQSAYMDPRDIKEILELKVTGSRRPSIPWLTTVAVAWRNGDKPKRAATTNGSHAPSKPPEPTVYFRADRTPKGPK